MQGLGEVDQRVERGLCGAGLVALDLEVFFSEEKKNFLSFFLT
jgi:hypothetical protein